MKASRPQPSWLLATALTSAPVSRWKKRLCISRYGYVPVVNVTLWSRDMDGDGAPDVDDGQLRLLAQDVLQGLKEVRNTGNAFIVGGRKEQVTVDNCLCTRLKAGWYTAIFCDLSCWVRN